MTTEVHIDRFGRVVIPKPLRDRLGLVPGTTLSIEVSDDHLVLAVLTELPLVERRDGVLVYRGEAAGELTDAIDSHRRSRLRAVTDPSAP